MYTTDAFDDSKIVMLLFSSAVSSPRGTMGRGAASTRATCDSISGMRSHPPISDEGAEEQGTDDSTRSRISHDCSLQMGLFEVTTRILSGACVSLRRSPS